MVKKNKNIAKNPYFRITTIVLILGMLIAIAVFSFKFIYENMFSENPHFRLRNVIVKSSGYWNNRAEDVMRILDLKKGVTNLFNLNLYELRRTLEERKGDGIAFAEVSKELPDTLKVEIVERIPQALLYNKKSEMLIDKDGIVMDAKYFKEAIDALPVITGFKITENSKFKTNFYGQTLNVVKPALVLISIINEDYSDIEVRVINLYSPNKLLVFIVGPGNRIIKVLLPFPYSLDPPTNSSELAETSKMIRTKLSELRELLKYLKWKNTAFTEINMLYKEQAVVK
jgi:cell division septal protein FtsQ